MSPDVFLAYGRRCELYPARDGTPARPLAADLCPFGMTMVHVSRPSVQVTTLSWVISLDGLGGDRPPWDRRSSPLP